MNVLIFISFYVLVKFIVTLMMSDKISNKNIAENSTEVTLRTTTEFEGSAISGCF